MRRDLSKRRFVESRQYRGVGSGTIPAVLDTSRVLGASPTRGALATAAARARDRGRRWRDRVYSDTALTSSMSSIP